MILAIILVVISYLMGSFCSAIIVCRTFNLPDPREEGSKNPGATNVLRIAGKQYAAIVMLVDVLKGTIPVVLAKMLDASPTTVSICVLATVVGHMYPFFFGFKGGKGVATAIGALLGFHFIIGVIVAATWLIVANFSRYSSLASIVSITLSPIYSLLIVQEIDIFPPLFFMALLILFKHKNNITRLIDGNEPKIILKSNVIEEIIESSPKQEPMPTKEMPVIPQPADKVVAKKISTEQPAKKTVKKPAKKPINKTDDAKTTKTVKKTTKKAPTKSKPKETKNSSPKNNPSS